MVLAVVPSITPATQPNGLTVTVTVLDGLYPCLNFLGKRKRPVAVPIANFDIPATTDPIVEEHAALAVYDFTGIVLVEGLTARAV